MISFWEKNSFQNFDYIIIGGGLLGLSVASVIKEKSPDKEVLILERGLLPTGASTKNAGFLCYGSLTEILADIRTKGEDEALKLVEKRWRGMNLLRKRLGDENIGFLNYGEYELIDERYLSSLDEITRINNLLRNVFSSSETFRVNHSAIKEFGFNDEVVKEIVFSPFESQIDTGKMMRAFFKYASSLGIVYLTGANVKEVNEKGNCIEVPVSHESLGIRFNFSASAVIICTNAFTSFITPSVFPKPARGLVISTMPVKGLKLKGIFHYDEGFYYFRNFGDRVILGGGRNLDFETEETHEFGVNPKIYSALEDFLRKVILPYTSFEIDCVWSGIMGFTKDKLPSVEQISERVIRALSCNGMGIALSSVVAEEVLSLLHS